MSQTPNANTQEIIKSIQDEQKIRLSQVGNIIQGSGETQIDTQFQTQDYQLQADTTNTYTENNFDINQNKVGHVNIQNNITLANLSLAGNRLFTKKMMKEVISSIYSSKIAFDKKCLLNKQAKQTMEEFMYTYLNQKYGLKNMVIEWAKNIINGIRNYSAEDTEISLFGKILQNELEENCQLLIPNLKENINTIILNILRNEYPYKNDIELNKMKNNLIKNELPPEKIKQIVEALFDEKGKEVLFDKINKEINNKKAIIMKNSKINGKFSREEINKINAQKQNECNFIQYDFLLDICLEYQIKLHIKYLKPFVKLFQSIDEDRDGVLNEEQFIELVKNLNIFGQNEEHLPTDAGAARGSPRKRCGARMASGDAGAGALRICK